VTENVIDIYTNSHINSDMTLEHGAIAFTELLARDVAGQRAFYEALFGWQFDDRARAHGANGALVAAIRENDAHGWIPHVAVDDVAVVARAAIERGASPSPSGELVDPFGAHFVLRDRESFTADHGLNAAGGLAWNEIWTPDLDATLAFYRGAIGWNTKEQGGYRMFAGRDRPTWTHGGLRPHDGRAIWASYFEVEDCRDRARVASELGATLAIEPTRIPGVGWIALAIDREGSRVGLMQSGA
jgi:hypothetical protein